ncbi:MAG: NAD-dependent epimerase/dehydratase family protein [Dehalococcoidia bacterium]|nr:NAD-dependent epimerase/dehydratase family protein [Dehalococcoidia bacterium]
MNVLVTGATGFLGSYLVDKCIEQGDRVRCLVRGSSNLDYLRRYREVQLSYGSLMDEDAIDAAMEGIEIVYHAAARSADWGTRRQFWESNYLGAIHVLRSCQKMGVKRLVYVSTPGVVYDYTDHVHIDESQPYPRKFANYYCEAKARAEQEILAANDPNGLETVAIRPHAIWGPRDLIGFVPRIVSRIVKKRMIKIAGADNAAIDMTYVTDAADACILAGKSSTCAGRPYFVSDGEETRIRDFVDRLCETLNLPKPSIAVPKRIAWSIACVSDFVWRIPYLAENLEPVVTRYAVGMATNRTTHDISAAKRDLGYEPKVGVELGLKLLKKWVDENGGVEALIRHVK